VQKRALPRWALTRAIGVASTLVVVATAVACAASSHQDAADHHRSAHHQPATSADGIHAPRGAYVTASARELAGLPRADYSAVIPGLFGFASASAPRGLAEYTLASDAALYSARAGEAVARLPARNFLHEPTVVDVVTIKGAWALVLTPARKALPSQAAGHAPAQTAAWLRASLLTRRVALSDTIIIAVRAQTLTIKTPDSSRTFHVGVGAPGTPTPTGVTGYLQTRYLDPSQGESVYPIQLTSLHATAADEPYRGSDGGLIGIHYDADHTGAISHGCIRLTPDALTAVNVLPLGTPVVMTR
jgi:lipoprotein-anchoring transpeptidase ErfK/SrfK